MARTFAIPAKRQLRMMRAIERRYEPQIAAELARAYTRYIAEWERGGDIPHDLDHVRAMAAIADEMARVAVRAFAADTDRVLSKAERKTFADTMAKLAQRYISLEAFRRRIVAIAETTRSQVIDAVSRGYAEGLGQSEVAKYIRDLVPQFSRHRAAVIARTEVHGAANYGSTGAAAQAGLTLRKVWIAAEDERTRDEHEAMNGKSVGMDDAFNFGSYSLMFPGDPAGPPEGIINCRCTLAYVPED